MVTKQQTEKYTSKPIKPKLIGLLFKNATWAVFCENRHGICYWNSSTGEILWHASEEKDSNASLLPETWKTLRVK